MATDKKEKCAHPSCVCMAAPDSKYCSTACEANAKHPDITCSCGHAGCSATATSGTAGGARSY